MSELEDCDNKYENSYREYQRKQINDEVGEW